MRAPFRTNPSRHLPKAVRYVRPNYVDLYPRISQVIITSSLKITKWNQAKISFMAAQLEQLVSCR